MKQYLSRVGAIVIGVLVLFSVFSSVSAQTLADRLKGRILLQIGERGEAWYVRPDNGMRVFMGRPADAFALMRALGLGITNAELRKIPVGIQTSSTSTTDTDRDMVPDDVEQILAINSNSADSDGDGYNDYEELMNNSDPTGSGFLPIDEKLVSRLKGRILLQVQRNGEAWYLNPVDGKRYFLGRPSDAFNLMRVLGLGITNKDLEKIPQASSPYQKMTSPSATVTQTTGVTWLSTPAKLSYNPNLFTQENGEPVTYYKTGSDNGRDIILANIPAYSPSGDEHAYFVHRGAGLYDYLALHSQNYDKETGQVWGGKIGPHVSVNTSKVYSAIKPPQTISYHGISLALGARFEESEPKKTRTLRLTTANGPLYTLNGPADIGGLIVQTYVLVVPNGIEYSYQYEPNIPSLDDGVLQVRWSDGTRNSDTYATFGTSGCGSGSYLTLLGDEAEKEIVQIGTAIGPSSEKPVYGFVQSNHKLILAIYETTDGYYYDASGEQRKFSIPEFASKRPLIVWKDEIGRYVVYNNTKYGPAAECGKPVMYLYPEQPTDVSVKVDASIRISEPAYGSGWFVRAYPDGTLEHANGTYDSLFWEGYGKSYPTITRGFVVAREDLESTLLSHLIKLGLNEKESADFMEFWLPKMPTMPYTRLSWLGTREMNALAPLSVAPKPDTMIRIFLDFEGLEEPIDLKPQILTSIPRTGFALVEWGGLLRNHTH